MPDKYPKTLGELAEACRKPPKHKRMKRWTYPITKVLPCGCPVPATRKQMCKEHREKLDNAIKKIRERPAFF